MVQKIGRNKRFVNAIYKKASFDMSKITEEGLKVAAWQLYDDMYEYISGYMLSQIADKGLVNKIIEPFIDFEVYCRKPRISQEVQATIVAACSFGTQTDLEKQPSSRDEFAQTEKGVDYKQLE